MATLKEKKADLSSAGPSVHDGQIRAVIFTSQTLTEVLLDFFLFFILRWGVLVPPRFLRKRSFSTLSTLLWHRLAC